MPRNPESTIASTGHLWRLCPLGQHWVKEHPLHVPPSNLNPTGITTRRAHCSNNPSHKDVIYSDELTEIAQLYFASLDGPPKNNSLKFMDGNTFDQFIRGWTKYWNEVLKPIEPLDPDLVKALIATESGFKKETKVHAGRNRGFARGLMQITDQTQKILGDDRGELHDHIVHVEQDEMFDPNLNIAAGIRWLFRKKEIAENQSGKIITWLDAISKYKDLPNDSKPVRQVINYYNKLKS